MHQKLLFYFFLSCIASTVFSQPYKISGKVINLSMEPLSYVSIQIKGHDQGVVSNTDGSFELELDNGQYDLVVSLTGYLSRVIPLVVDKADQKINIILEEDRQKLLSNVVIRGKAKDYAEEIIRNVIKGKDAINSFAEGDEQRMILMGLKRFTKAEPFNTKDARRRIADKMINEKRYCF